MMKAFSLLRRRLLGRNLGTGAPIWSKTNWRHFLIALLAGDRTVVINAEIRDGALCVDNWDALIVGVKITNSQEGDKQ